MIGNYRVIFLKKTCQQTLKNNRYVEKYKINNFNSGETLVDLK